MDKNQIIQLAAQAGFGANQRNTLLVKLMRFAELVVKDRAAQDDGQSRCLIPSVNSIRASRQNAAGAGADTNLPELQTSEISPERPMVEKTVHRKSKPRIK